LVFEKGGQTQEVWSYKVTNDGYTMGTNRRPISGCQLVEALQLFDKYIRHGKTPPETKHSFSVPAAWILNLDPRIKLRIEADITAEFSERVAKEKESLIAKLGEQVRDGKIDETDSTERLTQHDEIWRNKTLNEIAKRIEAAHLYSFNLPNARSNLSKSQLEEWNAVFKGTKRKNGHTLDVRYAALKDCRPAKAHSALAMLDVQDSLEFDIARQYLMAYPVEELSQHDQLATLRKIIESGAKYPRVCLGEYLRLNIDRIKPSDAPDTRFRVLGVSNTNGVFLNETKLGAEIKQAYYRVKPNEFCYNPYRVNVGSIGLCEFDYDNQIISGAYNIFGTDETELLPHYLLTLFRSPQFLAYVNEKAHGGVRMNFQFEDLEQWEIPHPPIERQIQIAASLEYDLRYVRSLRDTVAGWMTDLYLDLEAAPEKLEALCTVASSVVQDLSKVADLPYVGGVNIEGKSGVLTSLQSVSELGIKGPAFRFHPGQVVYSKIRPALRKCFMANLDGICRSDIYPLEVETKRIMPEYLFALLSSKYFADLACQFDQRAGIPKVNREQLYSITIPVPAPERQKILMTAMKEDFAAIQGLASLITRIECTMFDKAAHRYSCHQGTGNNRMETQRHPPLPAPVSLDP
jgi:restriction endonuclease S subunit